MRMFRAFLAVAMAMGMLVVLAGGASAKASATVCNKVALAEANLSQLGSGKFNASGFKKAAKTFKAGAKVAPAKVKSAMTTMASYYQKIANADSVEAAVTSIKPSDTTKYAKATVVWGTFVATECS